MTENPKLLSVEILEGQGNFRRAKLWYKGWYPQLRGVLTNGWRGEETVVTKTVVVPAGVIKVEEDNSRGKK